MQNLDPNEIKIDKKSYKNIHIYYIRYVRIKNLKYVTSGCFEEINGNKYLTLDPTDEIK